MYSSPVTDIAPLFKVYVAVFARTVQSTYRELLIEFVPPDCVKMPLPGLPTNSDVAVSTPPLFRLYDPRLFMPLDPRLSPPTELVAFESVKLPVPLYPIARYEPTLSSPPPLRPYVPVLAVPCPTFISVVIVAVPPDCTNTPLPPNPR